MIWAGMRGTIRLARHAGRSFVHIRPERTVHPMCRLMRRARSRILCGGADRLLEWPD